MWLLLFLLMFPASRFWRVSVMRNRVDYYTMLLLLLLRLLRLLYLKYRLWLKDCPNLMWLHHHWDSM